MLFKQCNHYLGVCPCLTCNKECLGCLVAPEGYAVDTNNLCEKARNYCENNETKGGNK